MKVSSLILAAAGVFASNIAFAESLVIEADGNYVSSEQIQLSGSAETLYDVTGTFTLSGVPNGPEAYVIVGLVPYGSDGDALQTKNDFSALFEIEGNGYMSIDTIEFPKDGSVTLNRRIRLGGSELKHVSFVVGAALEKGAKLTVSDLKMVPVDEASAADSSSVGLAKNNSSRSGSALIDGKNVLSSKDAALDIKKDKNSDSKKNDSLSDLRRVIFVNADTGSDKLAGLKRIRGQADGPKKTIKSALGVVANGDHIVLQESNAPYEVTTSIKAKPGQKLVIRAEGAVVIKAKQ